MQRSKHGFGGFTERVSRKYPSISAAPRRCPVAEIAAMEMAAVGPHRRIGGQLAGIGMRTVLRQIHHYEQDHGGIERDPGDRGCPSAR